MIKREKIFDFLESKKRTCKWILQDGQYSIEAPKMDRDFFVKYYKELFMPEEYGYIFEDSEKIIEIFEGGLKINKK